MGGGSTTRSGWGDRGKASSLAGCPSSPLESPPLPQVPPPVTWVLSQLNPPRGHFVLSELVSPTSCSIPKQMPIPQKRRWGASPDSNLPDAPGYLTPLLSRGCVHSLGLSSAGTHPPQHIRHIYTHTLVRATSHMCTGAHTCANVCIHREHTCTHTLTPES